MERKKSIKKQQLNRKKEKYKKTTTKWKERKV
jgi:hypothetical protein